MLYVYSFTPPSVIPVTKYFCKNGYSIIIGNMVTIVAAARTEVHGKHIGFVVMFAGVGMDEVAGFPADVRIILERSRHSGGRDI